MGQGLLLLLLGARGQEAQDVFSRGLLQTGAVAHRAVPGAGELGVTGLGFGPSSATDWQ